MGTIAEDMVDGEACDTCGEYFRDENGDPFSHGYPVICKHCFRAESDLDSRNRERNGVQVATVYTF